MSVVETIEAQITKLTPGEVAQLTRWLNEYDAKLWDQQMERDALPDGKLERLAKEAVAAYKSGRVTKLP